MLLRKFGKFENTTPRNYNEQTNSVPDDEKALIERLSGCHLNQLEMQSVYAADMAANVALGGSDSVLMAFTSLYIIFRIAYIAAHSGPQIVGRCVRSGTFVGCMIVVMLIWGKTVF
ncbi:unnamed protein product [Agarophyton chilense]